MQNVFKSSIITYKCQELLSTCPSLGLPQYRTSLCRQRHSGNIKIDATVSGPEISQHSQEGGCAETEPQSKVGSDRSMRSADEEFEEGRTRRGRGKKGRAIHFTHLQQSVIWDICRWEEGPSVWGWGPSKDTEWAHSRRPGWRDSP